MIISSNFLLALILNFLSYNLKGDVLNLLILINLYKLKVWLITNIYHFVDETYQLPHSACSIFIILLMKLINYQEVLIAYYIVHKMPHIIQRSRMWFRFVRIMVK